MKNVVWEVNHSNLIKKCWSLVKIRGESLERTLREEGKIFLVKFSLHNCFSIILHFWVCFPFRGEVHEMLVTPSNALQMGTIDLVLQWQQETEIVIFIYFLSFTYSNYSAPSESRNENLLIHKRQTFHVFIFPHQSVVFAWSDKIMQWVLPSGQQQRKSSQHNGSRL